MNNKTKNFIFNGLTYGLVFFGLSCILGYTFNLPVKMILIEAIPIGIISFLIFGKTQSRFTKSLNALESISIFPQIFETINLEAPANHMVNDHLISGKLFATDSRLIFVDWNRGEISWFLNQLHSPKFYFSMFNAGGEFIFHDENNNALVFEVDDIRLWKRVLKNSQNGT